ncbi:MAG: dual specificity protein phosphatase [Candidatus Sumerlaeia bacterium]|nr:dual specificity protein phosphatase [Candidatus Sumerlaeia bacterium]
MVKILERLYLCSLGEASDPYYLARNQVQAILHFGCGGMFPEEIKLYHRPVQDESALPPADLRDGVDFLRESLRHGRRVLAVGRSGATITAAYLTEMGFSPAQALSMIESAGGPTPNLEQVSALGSELERRSSISLGHRS